MSATLENLLALNDEIAALVRSGVPLELGLAELGGDMPGRLGKIATALAAETAQGKPLDQAILAQSVGLPPEYQAVVLAGMRAGRLPAALESIATAARRIDETRHVAVVAVTYPLLLFSLIWIGFAFFTRTLAPSLAASYYAFGMPGTEGIAGYRFLAALAWLGQSAWWWGTIVPAVTLLLLAAWCLACTRAAMLHAAWANWLLGRLPWVGRLLQWTRTAAFLELFALLIEHETPLDEAATLAACASGDRQTREIARRLVDALERGQAPPGGERSFSPSDFPPLVAWLLMAAGRTGALLPALKHAAATYHRRARHQADLVYSLLPPLLTLTFSGSLAAAYALMLFVPYTMMLRALAR